MTFEEIIEGKKRRDQETESWFHGVLEKLFEGLKGKKVIVVDPLYSGPVHLLKEVVVKEIEINKNPNEVWGILKLTAVGKETPYRIFPTTRIIEIPEKAEIAS